MLHVRRFLWYDDLMAATYFISDLHLADTNGPEFTHLAAWLPSLQPEDRLFILGDFFDAWVGDDAANTAENAGIVSLLSQTSQRGVALYFLHGNRDFLVGHALCQQIGAQLLNAPYLLMLDAQPWLLLHGDELCTDDIAYQQFRSDVRSDRWQQQFLQKPLSERLSIAKGMRTESKRAKNEKSMAIMDVNQDAVLHYLQAHPDCNLIHGHTHRPAVHTYGQQSRWVIPDWHGEVWGYLKWTSGVLSMHQFGHAKTT